MLVASRSKISGFNSNLFTILVATADRPNEQFVVSSLKPLGVDISEILSGARFIERLFRRNVPFIIVRIDDFDVRDAQRMCKGVYQPNLVDWESIIESEKIDSVLFNLEAINKLSINPFVETIESKEVDKWHEDLNLYVFVLTSDRT